MTIAIPGGAEAFQVASLPLRDGLRRKEEYLSAPVRHDFAAFASLRSAQAKR
jgi:hypothetical protein